jgi:hypothetical protein
MDRMEAWEWALLGVAGFVAIAVLATLMRRRRDQLFGQLRQELVREQQKKRLAEQKQKAEQKKKEQAQALRPPAAGPQPGKPAPVPTPTAAAAPTKK